MKYSGLLFANLFRKKTRLLLTLGSFVVALFLFGILTAIRGAFNQGLSIAGVDRLVVRNRVSLIQPLPIAYTERILRIKGVKQITHRNWFGGIYQDERNFFPQFAVDVDNDHKIHSEFDVPDEQWQTFLRDRQGAIVGANTAKRYHFKVGDHIPLRGTIFPGTWDFNIDGIYRGKESGQDETQFWFHWEYLRERAPDAAKNLVGWYVVQMENPDDSARVAKEIDDAFANSSYETHTETEKAFQAGFAKQFGNIELMILSIGSVVFFTLLLITGNTMAIAIRERTAELAVLKAIGYSDRFVLFFVLAESLLLALVGGGVGLGLAKLAASFGNPVPNILPYFNIPASKMLVGVSLALAVGVASGVIPAVGAMRLRVVNALRRV